MIYIDPKQISYSDHTNIDTQLSQLAQLYPTNANSSCWGYNDRTTVSSDWDYLENKIKKFIEEKPQYKYTEYNKNSKLEEYTNLNLDINIKDLLLDKFDKLVWNEIDDKFYTYINIKSLPIEIIVTDDMIYFNNNKSQMFSIPCKDLYKKIKPIIISKDNILDALKNL